jgi:hypothetical protein
MRFRIRIKLGAVRTDLGSSGVLVSRLRRCLGPASALSLVMALWRLAYELEWTDRFIVAEGIFSHWQVWMALTLALQVLESSLARFGHGGTATG